MFTDPAARRRGLTSAVLVAMFGLLGFAWITADELGPAREPAVAERPADELGVAAAAARGGGEDAVATRPVSLTSRERSPAAGKEGPVVIVADSAEHQVALSDLAGGTGTVADVLAAVGVTLGEGDRVEPSADTEVASGEQVVVHRATTRLEQREIPIGFDERERETDALSAGERRTVTEGRAGLVVVTQEVTVVDGEEIGREEVGRETAEPPRDTVVEVGTAQPEPAPQAASQPQPQPQPAPEPEPEPAPGAAESAGPDPDDPATWDRLAQCESGGNWQANTGNGYYGGLQFDLETWRGLGGSGKPHEHPRAVQIDMGQRLQARQGWAPWPRCSRQLGWR